MEQGDKPIPHVEVVILGSPGVGKSTFLSQLQHVQHPTVTKREQQQRAAAAAAALTNLNSSQTTLVNEDQSSHPTLQRTYRNDSQATLVNGSADQQHPYQQRQHHPPPTPRPNPQLFNVQLYARPYTIRIHTSTSPLFIDPFPLSPHLLILTFSIPSRASLYNVKHYWMPQYHLHYPTSTIPILLLGLQRDLRTAKKIPVAGVGTSTSTTQTEIQQHPFYQQHQQQQQPQEYEYECVMPEEGLQAAREMRVDRYAECSALTGELMWEATQDITKMAAMAVLNEDEDYASAMCTVL